MLKSKFHLPAIFLLLSIVLFGFSYYKYSNTTEGVYCKDCGSSTNCWQANGLATGYQSCQVIYDENGKAIDCDVSFWGGCQQYTGPRQVQEN